MLEIPFNKAPITGNEIYYIQRVLESARLCGDGFYSKKCESWFESKTGSAKTLITPSCTAALEMAAILINIQPGDEVIMPSYTFVSTANAFVLRGAKIIFVDIRPDTMNIDENLIEVAITEKTKAIVPVHYAGVACEMDVIMEIASKYELIVIEDAAQAVMSTYKGKTLGSIGHLATYSFHETKNYTSGGEGGLLLINDERFLDRAEIIREKGTNRKQFLSGLVDKYSWVDVGSSFLPSEVQAACLWGQLQKVDEINNYRLRAWGLYSMGLKTLENDSHIELTKIPASCEHNAHMFYIKVKDIEERTKLMEYLKVKGISSAFHYVPLHSSIEGKKVGQFSSSDNYTTMESSRLLRLPMYYGLKEKDIGRVTLAIREFYGKNQ